MDPKSCRQTPHWIIAMICSLSLILISVYNPSFVLWNVFLSWTFCFVDDCQQLEGKGRNCSTRGFYSAGILFCKTKARNAAGSVIITRAWTILQVFTTFLCANDGTITCPEYGLWCSVWRAAVCMKVEMMMMMLGRCCTRGWGSWLGRRRLF